MKESIGRAFPDKLRSEVKAIADQSLVRLAKGIVVFARLPDIAETLEPEWLSCEGLHHLDVALKKGHGVLTPSAHFGCWELLATYFMRYAPGGAAVARPLDNPRLDQLVNGIRSVGTGLFIPKRDVLKQGIRVLKKNGILGILMDQNFAPGGVFVPFLGRLAATTPIVPILARRTGAAIVPVHCEWQGRKTVIHVEPPVTLSRKADADEAIAEDTRAICEVMESWIRKDPANWLWLHNRWKRQPLPGEADTKGKLQSGDGGI
jgi:Kdo2-lipid IVA lauroyltransferase/acyltransferase